MLELARYAQSDDAYSVLELINVLNLSRSDVNPYQPQLLVLDSDGQFESYLANLCIARGQKMRIIRDNPDGDANVRDQLRAAAI